MEVKTQEEFLKAVDFYYQFKVDLEAKKERFERKYGFIPEFAASLNSGNIMVAEVGEIKNEIAYHGDVLNTAARIQKKCRKYDVKVLATEKFASNLAEVKNGYSIDFVANVNVSGKKEPVSIYKISPN